MGRQTRQLCRAGVHTSWVPGPVNFVPWLLILKCPKLCVTPLATRICVAHGFLKNLCVCDLGHNAYLGARRDCFQHKVIHLNKKCMFLISECSSFCSIWLFCAKIVAKLCAFFHWEGM
jgi:hypothetical protein